MMSETDRANAEFWDHLCGSNLARQIGITDHSKDSIIRFDKAYLDIYPYLLEHIQLDQLYDKHVLEIGLGYGTLGQKIAENAASYQGLDISLGPVRMMNHRLRLFEKKGIVVQGSARCMPFKDHSFDKVISIGCFHHTGDVEQCVHETHRVLRPRGRALVMLYNKFSLRQWTRWPIRALSALLAEFFNINILQSSTEAQRKAYDAGVEGEAAPATEFFSKNQIRQVFKYFSQVKIVKENCDPIGFARINITIPRNKLLPNLAKFAGLDLYIEAIK